MIVNLLTEEDVLGEVVDELSSEDVIRQLSVHLLPLPLKQPSFRPERMIETIKLVHTFFFKGVFMAYNS